MPFDPKQYWDYQYGERRSPVFRQPMGYRGSLQGYGGSGDDWWDLPPDYGGGPRSRYEEILDSLRQRSIADPGRQAEHMASGVSSHYEGFLDRLYRAGGAARNPGASTAPSRSQVLARLLSSDAPSSQRHAAMIAQAELGKAGAFARGVGSAYGPATSMIGTGYRGLQGYRGQDQQRYLEEQRMQHELQMMIAQLKAQAAGQGGPGFLDSLLGLAGMAFNPGGMFGIGNAFSSIYDLIKPGWQNRGQSPYNNPRGGV